MKFALYSAPWNARRPRANKNSEGTDRETMRFQVVKSYDGGKSWEPERLCGDFGSAADTAQSLRTAHPYLRFRVQAVAGGRLEQHSRARRA